MVWKIVDETENKNISTPTNPAITNIDIKSTAKEPSTLGEVGRHLLRTGARVEESLLGFPGDILQTGLDIGTGLVNYGKQKLIGGNPLEAPRSPLPTAADIKKNRGFSPVGKIAQLTGVSLDPQTRAEAKWDEFAQDLSTLLIPIGGEVKAGRALLTAGAGNLASLGAEIAGFGPTGQQNVKAGTMLWASLVGTPTARKHAQQLYNEIPSLIPEETKIGVKPLQDNINKIQKIVRKGDSPAKKTILGRLKAVSKAIDPTTYEAVAMDLWDLKKDINEWLRTPEAVSSSARKYLGELSGDISSALKEGVKTATVNGKPVKTYGKFAHNLDIADDIWRIVNMSPSKKTWIEQQLNKYVNKSAFKSPLLYGAFGVFPKSSLFASGTAYGLKRTVDLLGEFVRSPAAAKFYTKALGAAAAENANLFKKNLRLMEHELEKQKPAAKNKEVKKSKWRIVD